MMQCGRLVTVNVGGREVSFDVDDHKGIKEFFKSKTKKDTAFQKNGGRYNYSSRVQAAAEPTQPIANNGPW